MISKKKWLFKPTPIILIVLAASIGLNILGKYIAASLGLPFWFDSIGTVWSACAYGPLAGAIVGFLSNSVYAIFDIASVPYMLVSIVNGIIVGVLFSKKNDMFQVVFVATIVGFFSALISTPLNMMIYGGYTGNKWGDAMISMLTQQNISKAFSCFVGEAFIDIPDKALTLFAFFCVWKKKKAVKSASAVAIVMSIIIVSTTMTAYADNVHDKSLSDNSVSDNSAENEDIDYSDADLVDTDGSNSFSADYNCTYYGLNDGLSSIEINAIVQTDDGFIWAGSYAGLYRYNGSKFSDVNIDSRISSVTALEKDNSGNLWIGTNDHGIGRYNIKNGEIVFFDSTNGLASDSVRCLVADSKGNVYAGTTSYITKIDTEGNTYIYDSDEVKCATSLVVIGDDELVGVTIDGSLFSMKNGKVKEITKFDLKDSTYITFCSLAKDGEIIVGTSGNGIYVCNKDNLSNLKEYIYDEKYISYTNDISYNVSSDGYLICSNAGMVYVDSEMTIQNITTDEFSGSVTDSLVDYQGNMWFSSDKHGICKYSYNPFSDILRAIGNENHVVNSVLPYRGYLFIGTDDGLIVTDKETNEEVKIKGLECLDNVRIRNIYRDMDDNIWFSTYGSDGLICIENDGLISKYNETNGTVGGRFRSVIELYDGSILAASSTGLSYIKDGKVVKTISAEEGLDMPQILSMVQAKNGLVYAGSDGAGVFVIKDGKIIDVLDSEDGLNSLVVLKIVPCKQGYLYVTSDALYYNDGESIRRLNKFPYTNNYDVYISKNGDAWVLGSAGIYVVDLEKMINDEDYNYILLNKFDGLDTTLTANSWYCVDDDGNIYLCCSTTVKKVAISDINNIATDYNITIGEIKYDDEIMIGDFGNGIKVPAKTNRVTISPAVLNFSLSNPLVKVYLEGFDNQGVTTYQNDLSEISFTNIPHGNYKLHIQIIDELNNTVERDIVIPIEKKAQFFERMYFKIYTYAVLLFFIFIIAWLFAKYGSISKIKEQYNEIQKAKEEAENANKAKSQFLAKITHEIRTPINAILGMNELLMREDISSNVYEYSSEIKNSGESLLSIVNDILDLSKIESGKMNIIETEYKTKDMIDSLYSVLEVNGKSKGLKTELFVDSKLPRSLFGDEGKIKQVILNLISNAIKYTKEGSVTLTFKSLEREKGYVNIDVSVSDTGIGIKPEEKEKLFDSFERLDERANAGIQGTGLGLSITKELLALMESQITVESTYGEGSTFSFALKQRIMDKHEIGEYKYKEGNNEMPKKHVASYALKDVSILVVDDNKVNLKVVTGLLSNICDDVDKCSSGAECIAMATSKKYDVILLDSMMPDMDGTETLKKLREDSRFEKDTPVIALTANVFEGAREKYVKDGFNDYLAKPISGKKLEDTICLFVPDEKVIKRDNGDDSIQDKEAVTVGLLVNKNVGLEFCDNDEDLYKEVVAAYVEDSVEDMSNIEKAYADQDWKNYSVYVHGLKSASKSIGAIEVSEMAFELEKASKAGDEGFIKSHHDELMRLYKDTIEEIEG